MKIKITNFRDFATVDKQGNSVPGAFFAVAMTFAEGPTIVIDNFKLVGEKLYPPQKAGKNWHYDTVAISPKLAYLIAEAYRIQKNPNLPMTAGDTLAWEVDRLIKLYSKIDYCEMFDLYTQYTDEEGKQHVRL